MDSFLNSTYNRLSLQNCDQENEKRRRLEEATAKALNAPSPVISTNGDPGILRPRNTNLSKVTRGRRTSFSLADQTRQSLLKINEDELKPMLSDDKCSINVVVE